MTLHATPRAKSKKARVPSRFMRRVFKCPSVEDIRLFERRLGNALVDEKDDTQKRAKGRVELSDRLFSIVVNTLETIDLPIDRYHAWLSSEGRLHDYSGTSATLRWLKISDETIELTLAALADIEPYPSKRPVEFFSIRNVLMEIGDIWPKSMLE
jgi:hypothetical protein